MPFLTHLHDISGKYGGIGYHLVAYPEFLREGSAIKDYAEPSLVVLGHDPEADVGVLDDVFPLNGARVIHMGIREAMLVKYACNAWHATKVAFANEIDYIAKQNNASGRDIMHALIQDTTLNISGAYMRPGFAYGGSCLPKDTEALAAMVNQDEIPLLANLNNSNDQVIGRAVNWVCDMKLKRVGLVGLSFKDGTDDLRESPFIKVLEHLLERGIRVLVYDPDVNEESAGQYAPYLTDLMTLSDWADGWLIGKRTSMFWNKVNDKPMRLCV